MNENILSEETVNNPPSPVFEDTTPEAQYLRKRKKPMPTGAKVALIVVSIVLLFAILGALAITAVLSFFGVIIALVVVLTMPENDGTFEYEIYGDEIEIVGLVDKSHSGEVFIPEYIDEMPVTSIGMLAFYECYNITEVYIPDTVKTIDYGAFEDCRMLQHVSLGSSVERISDYAFCRCENLESIVIPDSVTSIGCSAFEYCYSLKRVEMGASVNAIEDYAFASCYALETVVLSPSLEYICAFAFGDCYSLKQITIPYSVNFIGRGAFFLCDLDAVYFENKNADWCVSPYYDEDKDKGDVYLTSDDLSPENASWFLSNQYSDHEWYCNYQIEE